MNWKAVIAVTAAAGGLFAMQQILTTSPNPRDVAYYYAQDAGATTVCYSQPTDISPDTANIEVRLTWPDGTTKNDTLLVTKSGRSFLLADNWELKSALPGDGPSQDKNCSNVSTPAINPGLHTP